MAAFSFIFALSLLLIVLGSLVRNIKLGKPLAVGWMFVYILGFCHFCLLSATLLSPGVSGDSLQGYNSKVVVNYSWLPVLGALHVLFLVVTLWVFRVVSKNERYSRLVPSFDMNPAAASVAVGALIGTSLAVLFSFMLPSGFIGLLFIQFRTGLASVAMGLATYYLISQRFNPAAWALFAYALVGGILATTVGSSGRRNAVSILLAAGWMWWFASLRYQRPVIAITKIAIVVAPVMVALLTYSAVRHQGITGEIGERAIQSRIETFVEAARDPEALAVGYVQVLYQDTSFNTLYILGHYPSPFPYRLLDDVMWFVGNPVPRNFWPGKPNAFGIVLQQQMNSAANLGPGVIGQSWAAAGIVGVIVYAAFFAFMIGIIDGAIKQRLYSPFFLAWIASDLGNLIALTRGDMALFTLQISASLVAGGVLLFGIKMTAGPLAAGARPLIPPLWRNLAEQQQEEAEAQESEPGGDDSLEDEGNY